MFKYLIWILKVGPAVLWHYFTWMRRYARHPERYPQEKRFARGKKLARSVLRKLNVDVDVRNLPTLEEGAVYYFVGNHTSLLDAVVTLAYLPVPVKYVSKKETRELPFVNTMFRNVGGVYVERDNLKQEIKVMQEIRESLAKKDSSWLVFPEGTRKRDYHAPLLDYKAGSFKPALQTKTPIIPFVIWGNQLVLPRKTRAKRFKVILEFLPTYIPMGTTSEVASQIYEDSTRVTERLKEEYRKTQKLNKYGQDMITPPND